jgi:thiol-disulfide isomerase/thioredoxin
MGRGPRLTGLAPSPLRAEGEEGVSRRSLVAAGLVLLVPGVRAAQVQPNPGTLPVFQALDLEGRKIAVPLPGKPTVVNFWASWCEPCRTEMPLLQQMADFYSDRMVLQAVNFKERAVLVQRHVKVSAWQVPVLLDPLGEGATAWQVKIFPTTVGFDAAGRPRWRIQGEFDWSGAEAGKLVEGLWR